MNIKKEILRYFVAGTIVVATDMGIYYLLIRSLPFSIAKGISFTCAGIVGYVLNKYWTFRQAQRSYTEVGRYAVTNMSALGFNVLTNQGILVLWSGAVGLALVTATALTSLLTYACFTWWVFKP